MKFEMVRDSMTSNITFRGEVSASDLAFLRLDRLDRALLDDIGSDSKATAADYLLALEMIFRRHAEQNSSSNTK